MARCIVVNADDQVIGYREREAFRPGEYYRITILCIFDGAGRTLLAQRAAQKRRDPGCWSPAVGGTVEEGETYDGNIIKEAREELGLEGVAFLTGPKLQADDIGNGVGYICQSYYCMLDWPAGRFRLQAEEVSALRWVDLATLRADARDRPESYTINFADSLEAVGMFAKVLEP